MKGNKKKHNNVITLEDIRKINLAKKQQASEIAKEMMDKNKYSSAVAFFVPVNGEPFFVATSKLNPLECSGLLLNFSMQCAQRNSFSEAIFPENEKTKTS